MSIIVYGPPGCGKTTNAERLRKHFGLAVVNDSGLSFEVMANAFNRNGTTLYLTNDKPPEFCDKRLVVSFYRAMVEATGA